MNRQLTAICLLSSLALVGCNNEEPEAAPVPAPAVENPPAEPITTPPPAENGSGLSGVIENSEGLMDRAGEMLGETKDAAVAAAEAKLAELRPEVERLQARGAELTGRAKTAFDAAIGDVEEQLGQIDVKLAELREAGADQWREVSAELGAAMERLGESLAEAQSRLAGEPGGGA